MYIFNFKVIIFNVKVISLRNGLIICRDPLEKWINYMCPYHDETVSYKTSWEFGFNQQISITGLSKLIMGTLALLGPGRQATPNPTKT